jgi:hypothetical protein
MDKAKARQVPELAKEWERRHPPEVSDNDYWFYAGRADTYEKLLGWTAHLLGKNWFVHTNWSAFLYRVLNANGCAVVVRECPFLRIS